MSSDQFTAIKSKISRVASLLCGYAKHDAHEYSAYWRSEIHFAGHKIVASSREIGENKKIELWYARPKSAVDFANFYAADQLFKAITTTINVGQGKTAEQIARDISRRFDWNAIGEALRVQTASEESANELLRKHTFITLKVMQLTGAVVVDNRDPLKTELRDKVNGVTYTVTYLKIDVSFCIDANEENDEPEDWQKMLTLTSLASQK